MLLTLFFNHIDTTQEPSTTSQVLIVEILVKRHNARVGIISVQHHKLLLGFSTY
jgi:hypothetical protein